MARIAKELKALEVSRIMAPGYHAVGAVPGLTLQVTANGARSWILRVKVGSKRREIGLGPYPGITLANAHEKARAVRESIDQGNDPVLEKKTRQSALLAKQAAHISFEDAARACYTARAVKWRNAKHGAQWLATLKTYAFPKLGKLAVADITLPHVLSVLEPIWLTKHETASRVRGRLETVLNWATTKGHRKGENPARWRGHLDQLLATPENEETHHPAVPTGEAGAFMHDLKLRKGNGARCLEFAMLCASRSGEVRGAVWSEFDLTRKIWTIPANRMKGKIEHRVPLTESAIGILNALPRFEKVDWVFASPTGKQLSDMTLSQLMRRMDFKDADGRVCVPHGLRSTFRDWAAERTSFDRSTIEAALAHKNADKVEAAYLRSDVLDKRRQLMEKWDKFLSVVEQKSATVVPINKKVA